MIADHIDQVIMFCVGIWMTAVGFGYVPLPGNAAAQQPWVLRIASQFKWMGPLLLAISVILALAG